MVNRVFLFIYFFVLLISLFVQSLIWCDPTRPAPINTSSFRFFFYRGLIMKKRTNENLMLCEVHSIL